MTLSMFVLLISLWVLIGSVHRYVAYAEFAFGLLLAAALAWGGN